MKKILGLVFVACLIAIPVHADSLSNSYVQLAFVDVDIDDANVSGDGFQFAASGELSQRWFLFGAYSDIDFDASPFERQSTQLGVGYSHGINDRTDFFATAAYIDVDLEAGIFSFDDDGYALGVGIRTLVADDKVELGAKFDYVDFDDSEEIISAFALWNFHRRWSVGAELGFSDLGDTIAVGIRYYFNE